MVSSVPPRNRALLNLIPFRPRSPCREYEPRKAVYVWYRGLKGSGTHCNVVDTGADALRGTWFAVTQHGLET